MFVEWGTDIQSTTRHSRARITESNDSRISGKLDFCSNDITYTTLRQTVKIIVSIEPKVSYPRSILAFIIIIFGLLQPLIASSVKCNHTTTKQKFYLEEWLASLAHFLAGLLVDILFTDMRTPRCHHLFFQYVCLVKLHQDLGDGGNKFGVINSN